jgi:hypothetical protein
MRATATTACGPGSILLATAVAEMIAARFVATLCFRRGSGAISGRCSVDPHSLARAGYRGRCMLLSSQPDSSSTRWVHLLCALGRQPSANDSQRVHRCACRPSRSTVGIPSLLIVSHRQPPSGHVLQAAGSATRIVTASLLRFSLPRPHHMSLHVLQCSRQGFVALKRGVGAADGGGATVVYGNE